VITRPMASVLVGQGGSGRVRRSPVGAEEAASYPTAALVVGMWSVAVT
jgi:hypothetical protein